MIGLVRLHLLQPGEQRCPIGDDHQDEFVGLTHHEAGLNISQTSTLLDNGWAVFYRYASIENPPGVVAITSFTASTPMLEVFVECLGLRVFLALASPDPLIDRAHG